MTAGKLTSAPQQIGKYRITGELGRGGMGIVYRGQDLLIGREVAIKTLTETTPELMERFYLEAKSGILSHLNIVTVYELGEHEGNPFIVMQLVPGDSLEKVLRVRRRLPPAETLSIVEQLCAGLGYAHSHGVLHRDIKPANVLLEPNGRVTIVDFGIARLANQARQLTKTDALLGTFHYIAPERLKGEAGDSRADLWSVGVMLYQMLTGELPFKGKDVSALYRVIHDPYVPLVEHVRDLPKNLDAVVARALAKDADARYRTAEEMEADLRVVAEDLERERVPALLETAERLAEERQFASARTVLLQAQKISPGNADVKALLGQVQEKLSQLQRSEQARQILDQARAALSDRRWDEAIGFLGQAQKLDTENAFGIDGWLHQVQEQKTQQQKVMSLWEQASQARSRGDLTMAQGYLQQALQIDEHSTDLRNAYAVVLREAKRKEQVLQVEELLRGAREDLSARHFTEAIARLREAVEIDPLHTEVQQLLFSATTRQKEERRQVLLEKIVAEIQECLHREEFAMARDRVTRALETLPGEAMLLRLQAETEGKHREFEVGQVVRSAVLEAQKLFSDDPGKAFAVLEQGLERAPANEALLEWKAKVGEHLREIGKSTARTKALEQARLSIESGKYADAQRTLESAAVTCGASEDLQVLLTFAAEQGKLAEEKARREAIVAEAEEELRAGRFKQVMDRLQPLVKDSGEAQFGSLFAEAQRRHGEMEERLLWVLRQGKALGEADAGQGLQLLREQPLQVRESEQARALKQELEEKLELVKAVQAATSAFEEALAAGDLKRCMQGFHEAATQYGASTALTEARKRCEAKRQQMAEQRLEDAIGGARRLLGEGKEREAQRSLRRAEYALPFAREATRREWAQVKEDRIRARAGRVKAVRIWPGRRGRRVLYAIGGTAGVAALAVVGLVHGSRERAPVNPVPQTPLVKKVDRIGMELNAMPWATVVSVRDREGKLVALPAGDHATPLRLDGLPAGEYRVVFAGANSRKETVTCTVTEQTPLCTANLGAPDTQTVLEGVKP